MLYVFGFLIPILLQSLFVFILIEMNTGNGSWLGLGALLIGMFAIPATGIVNLLYIKSNKEQSSDTVLMRCFLTAIIAPFLTVLLLLVG